jgi:hypothetical protein
MAWVRGGEDKSWKKEHPEFRSWSEKADIKSPDTEQLPH